MRSRILRGLLFTMVFFAFFTVESQVVPVVRIGVAVSTLSRIGDLYDNNCLTVSYVAGGAVIIPIKNMFSLQSELNMIRKGRYDKTKELGKNAKTLQYINYLQFPVLLRVTPNGLAEDSKAKIFFNIGPYGSLLINAKSRVNTDGNSVTRNQKDSYKSSDFGIIFGNGVQFPIKQTTLQIDLLYDMGLTKISKLSDSNNTKSFSLAIGVSF